MTIMTMMTTMKDSLDVIILKLKLNKCKRGQTILKKLKKREKQDMLYMISVGKHLKNAMKLRKVRPIVKLKNTIAR